MIRVDFADGTGKKIRLDTFRVGSRHGAAPARLDGYFLDQEKKSAATAGTHNPPPSMILRVA